jgi:hypothetical protein
VALAEAEELSLEFRTASQDAGIPWRRSRRLPGASWPGSGGASAGHAIRQRARRSNWRTPASRENPHPPRRAERAWSPWRAARSCARPRRADHLDAARDVDADHVAVDGMLQKVLQRAGGLIIVNRPNLRRTSAKALCDLCQSCAVELFATGSSSTPDFP